MMPLSFTLSSYPGIELPSGRTYSRMQMPVDFFASRRHIAGTLADLARKPSRFSAEHVTLLEVVSRDCSQA